MGKELEPLPEPLEEPELRLEITCWNCNHKVRSSLENTHNFIHTKQVYFNYTLLDCLDSNCEKKNIMFHDQVDDSYVARAMQYPTTITEYCDDTDVVKIRAQVLGISELQTHDLSKRAEEQIAHWGEFLQRVVVDETDFGVGNETA